MIGNDNPAGEERQIENAKKTINGFIDIMYEKKKLPWSYAKNLVYRLVLIAYFFINFVHSIIARVVRRDQLIYYYFYMSISFIGFVFELLVTIAFALQRCLDQDANRETQRDNDVVGDLHKRKHVFVDYVILSIGEFLIYPTLICVMYGFINERAWQFDNGISGYNFVLLVYSVIMDALYMKFYVIWLVIRIVHASYHRYDELALPREDNRNCTPVCLSIPLAIGTALTHWFMTAIIGVRIYVDNFTMENNNINSSIPDTGDYRVAPLTGYMIGCTICLPIVSWITYIIINKPWFYEVYFAINQLSNGGVKTWTHKLFAFTKDYLAYISIGVLIILFIPFAVGIYLPDYNSSEYEVASSVRTTAQVLGYGFVAIFFFCNLQAIITLFTLVIILVILLLWQLLIWSYQCCKKLKLHIS